MLVGDFSGHCETSRRFVESSDLSPLHVTCPLRSGSMEVRYEGQGIELIWSIEVRCSREDGG